MIWSESIRARSWQGSRWAFSFVLQVYKKIMVKSRIKWRKQIKYLHVDEKEPVLFYWLMNFWIKSRRRMVELWWKLKTWRICSEHLMCYSMFFWDSFFCCCSWAFCFALVSISSFILTTAIVVSLIPVCTFGFMLRRRASSEESLNYWLCWSDWLSFFGICLLAASSTASRIFSLWSFLFTKSWTVSYFYLIGCSLRWLPVVGISGTSRGLFSSKRPGQRRMAKMSCSIWLLPPWDPSLWLCIVMNLQY